MCAGEPFGTYTKRQNRMEKTMTTRINNFVQTTTLSVLHLAILFSLAWATPMLAQDTDTTHAHASQALPAKLVHDVRVATQQFINVNNAVAAGYGPAFGCVSGPDHGAMGIHYVNGTLVRSEEHTSELQS